ncbi:MAG: hypothetical protein ACLQOZ_06470 [Acidimicrobiales bacterium]
MVVVAGLVVATPSLAQATAAPSLSISPASGPVGTTVTVRGNAGSGCSGTSFLQFEQGTSGPVEFIVPPMAADGSWSASFVIPPFVGYLATRGYPGADVTPGPWELQGPDCNGQGVPSATFEVTGTSSAQPTTRFAGMAATPDGQGYWLVQSGGGVFSYGDAGFHGALPSGPGGLGITPAAPISGIATTPDGHGYWLVGQDGGVYAFGDAGFYGSLPGGGTKPYGVVVGITPTPSGHGYWLVGADGGVYAFGDAGFYGAPSNGMAVTALLATPSGKGYMAIPTFGDAPVTEGDATLPSDRIPGPMTIEALVSGGAVTSDAGGFWEVSTDGGVFAYGDAGFHGSLPGIGASPAAPIVGMTRTPDGGGYWLVGADGGVFAFGNAPFYGSAA